MTEALYLIVGGLLLLLVMYDFFYTTLSGSGAGFLTRLVMFGSYKLLQLLVIFFGRRMYNFSGMLVNLMVLSTWVLMAWLGLLLLYTFHPEGIINSSGRVATWAERLYFTGYTLSTLGIGNFKPDTAFFEVLTSCFSFFGFVFFTTAMTYLISVSSAVIHKRSLALSIRNMGATPEELINNLLNKDASYCYNRFTTLQEMFDRHSVNHQAYPVVHFYSNYYVESSLSINLAVLDEALTILLTSAKGAKFHAELIDLRRSVTHFLNLLGKNYPQTLHREISSVSLPLAEAAHHPLEDEQLKARRIILRGVLKNESFGWEDVYQREEG